MTNCPTEFGFSSFSGDLLAEVGRAALNCKNWFSCCLAVYFEVFPKDSWVHHKQQLQWKRTDLAPLAVVLAAATRAVADLTAAGGVVFS